MRCIDVRGLSVRFSVGLLVALSLIIAPQSGSRVVAQQAGQTLTFLSPQAFEVALPIGDDPGDKVVYTGHVDFAIDGGTCATGTFPIQNVALVDPRQPGARTTRHAYVVTINSHDAVTPGTRLGSLQKNASCTAGGIEMDKYTGVVE